MAVPVAVRRTQRSFRSRLDWSGSGPLAVPARPSPTLRRLARRVGQEGPGEPVVATAEPSPLAVVAHLWVGCMALFMLVVFGGLIAMTLIAWAFGYRPVVVTTGSMAPLIQPGDVVITAPSHGIKLGNQTVIDFIDPVTGHRHLHRVIEVNKTGYRTKGDANPTADQVQVPPSGVRGVGVLIAPFIGDVPMWIDQGRWDLLGALLVGIALSVHLARRAWMWGARGRRVREVT